MRPKFEVGEEVILVSVSCPELNGEATVLSVKYCEYINNRTENKEEGYLYELTIESRYSGWMESALRKKHKPSDMSFHELMDSLNTTLKV